MRQWYILNFHGSPLSFSSLLMDLKYQDNLAEVWIPCYFVRTKEGVVRKSLFPGYLFVQWEYSQEFDDFIRENYKGSCFLKVGLDIQKGSKKVLGLPYVLSEEEIQRIRDTEMLCDNIFRNPKEISIKEYKSVLGFSEEDVSNIMGRLSAINRHDLCEGEIVEIIEGPFNCLKGKVLEVNGEFVSVELSLFSRQIAVTVGVLQCQKII